MTQVRFQVDLEATLQDPHAFFAESKDIAAYPQLSRKEKLAILGLAGGNKTPLACQHLKEGMGGGEENILGRVKRGIRMVRQEHV
jgi:hypothetical protein